MSQKGNKEMILTQFLYRPIWILTFSFRKILKLFTVSDNNVRVSKALVLWFNLKFYRSKVVLIREDFTIVIRICSLLTKSLQVLHWVHVTILNLKWFRRCWMLSQYSILSILYQNNSQLFVFSSRSKQNL